MEVPFTDGTTQVISMWY